MDGLEEGVVGFSLEKAIDQTLYSNPVTFPPLSLFALSVSGPRQQLSCFLPLAVIFHKCFFSICIRT